MTHGELGPMGYFMCRHIPWYMLYLVGGWALPTPLKNIMEWVKVSWDNYSIPKIWKVMSSSHVPVTTNQSLPSGKLTVCYRKSQFIVGKSTISMAMPGSKPPTRYGGVIVLHPRVFPGCFDHPKRTGGSHLALLPAQEKGCHLTSCKSCKWFISMVISMVISVVMSISSMVIRFNSYIYINIYIYKTPESAERSEAVRNGHFYGYFYYFHVWLFLLFLWLFLWL